MASLSRFMPSNSETPALRGWPSAQVPRPRLMEDTGCSHTAISEHRKMASCSDPQRSFILVQLSWAHLFPLKIQSNYKLRFPKYTSSANSFVICSVTSALKEPSFHSYLLWNRPIGKQRDAELRLHLHNQWLSQCFWEGRRVKVTQTTLAIPNLKTLKHW